MFRFKPIISGSIIACIYLLMIYLARELSLPDQLTFGGDIFRIEHVSQGWGTMKKNRSVIDLPLRMNGKEYTSGIGTHAHSEIRINVYKAWQRFSGKCGVDDAAGGAGSIECIISINGKEIYRSPVIRVDDAPAVFSVPIDGANMIDLVISDSGDGIAYDHADWVDLQFE